MPRLDLIGIVTRDVRASLEFYRRLGVEVPAADDGAPHVEAPLPGGLRLAWDRADVIAGIDPARAAAAPTGAGVGLAFLCDGPADVDTRYAELDALGHGLRAPWDAPWGQRYALVRDPDGTTVDLFAPLGPPGS